MAKFKNVPKKGAQAGFAARTAPPVNDSTSGSSTEYSEEIESQQTSDNSSDNHSMPPIPNPKLLSAKRGVKKTTAATSSNSSDGTTVTYTQAETVSTSKVKKAAGAIKKKKKNKVMYTKVLKEIAKQQKSTALCIPKAPFLRLVRNILNERGVQSGGTYRITETALEALRESSEMVLTSMFEDAYLITMHAKRVTLMSKDIRLLLTLRHDDLSNALG